MATSSRVDEVVDAVVQLQAERDALRALLAAVLDGEFSTDGDRVVVRVPRDAFTEARARLS